MKTVLLCGGFGTRIRDVADDIPKPLIKVGEMPILWHLIGYYASFGFREFVLCLGYKSETVVDFFSRQKGQIKSLKPQPELPNTFQFDGEINGVNCSVTMAYTGLEAMTGARIRKIQNLVGNETFMLSYGDGLSDVNLKKLTAHHDANKKTLTVTGVRPPSRFGEIQVDDLDNSRIVECLGSIEEQGVKINIKIDKKQIDNNTAFFEIKLKTTNYNVDGAPKSISVSTVEIKDCVPIPEEQFFLSFYGFSEPSGMTKNQYGVNKYLLISVIIVVVLFALFSILKWVNYVP